MSDEIVNALPPLRKQISGNKLWGILCMLLALLLATTLAVVVSQGLDLLNEQIGESPKYQLEQTKIQLTDMKKVAETQYDTFRESNIPDPLNIMANSLKLSNSRQIDIETNWFRAVDLYSKVINRLTNHLGNIKEWQYFYDKKLAKLIAQSKEREEQMHAIRNDVSTQDNVKH